MQVDNSLEEEMTFEAALDKLEGIVEQLETGDLPLEESLKAFEEGIKLSRLCSQQLNDAELRVEKLIAIDDDGIQTAPFEISGEEQEE